jgi:hypothetical protein
MVAPGMASDIVTVAVLVKVPDVGVIAGDGATIVYCAVTLVLADAFGVVAIA